MTIQIIKFVALFLAIWWTAINVSKAYYKDSIPKFNFLLQAIGITVFVWLQWLSE